MYATMPAAASKGKWRLALMVGVPLVVLAIVAAGIVAYMRVYSFNARINQALAENHLFAPPGSSVADIYAAKKASSPNSSDLQAAGAKIRAKLAPIGDELLRKWYVDSEGVDWEYGEKIYGFLQEVAPNDPAFNVRHNYMVAQTKLQNRDYATALSLYQQALTTDPKFVLALNGIAKVYIQDGSPLKNEALALDYYGRVIQTDPNFTWAYKNVAEYWMQKENWPQAEAYMLRALATSPQRPSILRALGRIYFNMSRWPEALDYYERYVNVATDPDGIARAQSAIQQIRQKLGR
jgi:tetratricopeptide (TPR) repeat protein